jgi:hypothetical protein
VGAVVAHANAFPQCWVVLRTEVIAVMSEVFTAVCEALQDAARPRTCPQSSLDEL